MLHPLAWNTNQNKAYIHIDMEMKSMDTNLLRYHKPDMLPWMHVFLQKVISHRLREKQNPYPKFNEEGLSQRAVTNTGEKDAMVFCRIE
jgi:hypothetical protein